MRKGTGAARFVGLYRVDISARPPR